MARSVDFVTVVAQVAASVFLDFFSNEAFNGWIGSWAYLNWVLFWFLEVLGGWVSVGCGVFGLLKLMFGFVEACNASSMWEGLWICRTHICPNGLPKAADEATNLLLFS